MEEPPTLSTHQQPSLKRPAPKCLPDLLPISRSPLPSDRENNNFINPKCTIISNHKITGSESPILVCNSVEDYFREDNNTKKLKTADFGNEAKNEFTNIETKEKLFIRLVKIDISEKLAELNPDSPNPKPRLSTIKVKPTKPTKKVSKSELKKHHFKNINKTESLKMEQLLLKKFNKAKEKLTENGASQPSETSGSEVEPYVYEKTSKTVYETYEQVTDQNGDTILQCLLCPVTGRTFKQISLHYKFKHRDTPIEEMHFCNVKGCKFKTVHKGIFTWHTKRHMLASDKLESEVYPCLECNKVFDQRKGFLIHLKHMHKEPELLDSSKTQAEFPCGTCKFTTTTKQNLKEHIYRCHIPDEGKPKFTCNICEFVTSYKSSFKKHLTGVHLKMRK